MRINGKISNSELEQYIFFLKSQIVNTYLKKIYHFNGLFLFKFNKFSFVYDRNYLYTGSFSDREKASKMHSIVLKLRKEIGDKRLLAIEKFENNDKTVLLVFTHRKLILELYDQGNIIILDNDNKILKVLREIKNKDSSKYIREHGMIYPMKSFQKYDHSYELTKFGWNKEKKEIIVGLEDFNNISEALSSLWSLKIKKKEIKFKSKKKKLTANDHLENQKKKLSNKILNKQKQIDSINSNENIDFKQLNILHKERKKLESKLNKAKQIKVIKNKNKEAKEEKITLVTNYWYQKYHWWFTKSNFLVVGGKNSTDNETLVKTYLKDSDYYFHTDEAGSGSFIMITNGQEPNDIDLDETAEGVLALSTQWNSSYTSGEVYYVKGNQVSKTPNSGEYIQKGSFIIRGKRNYIKVTGCTLGYGLYNDNQLMLAPYRIINRLKSGKIKIKPSSKKTKGKVMSSKIKEKLNVKLPDNISLFNKKCSIT